MEVMFISLNKQFLSDSSKVLKKILSNTENLDIVKQIFEDFIKLKVKEIILREELNQEDPNFPPPYNYGIATYRIVTEEDEEYNFGIQIVDGIYIQERLLIFAASTHVNQERYKTHNQKVKTITLNIVDEEVMPTVDYHNAEKLIDSDGKVIYGIEIHVIELPKFNVNEIHNPKEAWTAYIKADNEKLLEEAKEKYGKIKKLDNKLNEYWKNEMI